MSSRLRNLDSKISFFAFADIITAVSGVLIFVALLLATDLGVPTNNKTPPTDPGMEQQLQEVLAQQAEVDAQNQQLQEILATANTSPDPDKLQTDIKRLKTQLAAEQQKQSALLQQMTQSQAAIAKRDAELGLTTLKAQIEKENRDIKNIADHEAGVKTEAATIGQHIAGLESKLVQLRQREGKLWLIPEKGTTTKQPVLAVVSGKGISLERFNQPEKTKQFDSTSARHEYEGFLKTLKTNDEYVVFLIRPSGVPLFQDLVKTTRSMNIDVGYDALEEDKDVFFAPPPVLDETVPVHTPTGYTLGSGGYPQPSGGGGTWSGSVAQGGGQTAGDGGHPQPLGGGGTSSGNGGQTGGQTPGTGSGAPGGSPGANGGGSSTSFSPAGTSGQSNNGSPDGKTGTTGGSSGSPNGTGNSAASASGTGTAASGSETGTANGSGNSKSGSAKTGATNGSSNGTATTTNAPTGEVKKDTPKTTPATKPPTPPAKSWWRRFLDWLFNLFR